MEQSTIWRYLDLAKFIGLIQSNSLFLSRADMFDDPFEGTINKSTYESFISEIEDLQGKSVEACYVRLDGEWVVYSDNSNDDLGKSLFLTLKWLKTYTYVNCWHQSDHESEAMWKLYSKNIAESLVVKTSISRLEEALPSPFKLEPVVYKNYDSNFVMDNYFLSPFKTKRLAFSHEKEVRIIIQEPPLKSFDSKHRQFDKDLTNTELGKVVHLKGGVQQVIEEIRLSPLASSWYEKLVKDLLVKYQVDIPVIRSEISVKPFELKS
ncbi:hypothetical protein OPW39_08210 [Vibrio europaeus]|uniref:hypothetical protein n=1 Tax=Vibrio europaeus TaxID=300876 RepID=UPI00233E6EE6|nr:hypothetical protein [Vibrio europaeus]MDC5868809.1 hypothetical protein [Vibrio europaeus]